MRSIRANYTILYYTIIYYTIRYHTRIDYTTILYNTIQYYTILHYTILVLYSHVDFDPKRTVPYFILFAQAHAVAISCIPRDGLKSFSPFPV